MFEFEVTSEKSLKEFSFRWDDSFDIKAVDKKIYNYDKSEWEEFSADVYTDTAVYTGDDRCIKLKTSLRGEGNFNIPHFLGILKAKKPFINVLLEASTPENVKASCDYIRKCYENA